MSALTHPLLVLSLILLQATPQPSPLRVSVVGNKSFWPETLADWAGLLSGVAIIGGAIWALRSYREAQRLKASEILLSMEQEFRIVLPTYELIENPGVYEAKIQPLLKATMTGANLSDDQIKLLSDLDRSLRFLYLCSVLNQDLAVEHNALMLAYHGHISMVATMTKTRSSNALGEYITLFYPTLCAWINANEQRLVDYRAGKPFKVRWFRKS